MNDAAKTKILSPGEPATEKLTPAPARAISPAAARALAEAAERRASNEERAGAAAEAGGPKGLEPTRYGDWERKGLAIDF